jgi:hypothetical protein
VNQEHANTNEPTHGTGIAQFSPKLNDFLAHKQARRGHVNCYFNEKLLYH